MSWFTKGIKSHESVPLENNSPSTSTGNSSNNKFINNHVIRNVQTIGTQTATFSKHDNICQTEIPTRRNHSTQCDKTENKAKYNNIDGFDVKIFSTFYRYLSSNGQLKDFISLVEGLINNKIQSKNMAWKAALRMGRYAQCKSTTGMRYDSDYVEFLSLLYLLFGGSALNVIRGPVYFASVVGGKAMTSCYDPALSRCSFPVPDVTNLRKINTGYPKITEAGILQFTLDVCEKQAHLGT